MPLPTPRRLYTPHPLPVTPEDNGRNMDNLRLWSDRLPFFGPNYLYMIRPEFGTHTVGPIAGPEINQTPHPASAYDQITWGWGPMYEFDGVNPYPYANGLATNGGADTLRFPYLKEEAFTAIRVDLSWLAYAGSASTTVALVWRMANVDDRTAGYNTALPASNAPWLCNPGDFLAARQEFTFVTLGQIVPFAPSVTILPPHERGWWTLELLIGAFPNNISFNEDCTLQVCIQEILPEGEPYPFKALPPL